MKVEADHNADRKPSPTVLFAACLKEVRVTWQRARQAGRPMTAPNLRRLFERTWRRMLWQAQLDDDDRLDRAGLDSIRRQGRACFPFSTQGVRLNDRAP